MKVGIFRAEAGENEEGVMEYAKNTQAVVFTIVHGVFTVALIAFATLAIVFKKKA